MERSLGAGGSSRARINKQFIVNTVDGLKSHNRREEEEDCWRQHRLELETQHRMSQTASRRRKNKKNAKGINASVPSNATDERQFWAQAKAQAMGAAQSDGTQISPPLASIESGTSLTFSGQAVAREVQERYTGKTERSEEIKDEVGNKDRLEEWCRLEQCQGPPKSKKHKRGRRDKGISASNSISTIHCNSLNGREGDLDNLDSESKESRRHANSATDCGKRQDIDNSRRNRKKKKRSKDKRKK